MSSWRCWQNNSAGRAGDHETAVAEAGPVSLGVLDGDCVLRELGHDASMPARRRMTVSATSLHWCRAEITRPPGRRDRSSSGSQPSASSRLRVSDQAAPANCLPGCQSTAFSRSARAWVDIGQAGAGSWTVLADRRGTSSASCARRKRSSDEAQHREQQTDPVRGIRGRRVRGFAIDLIPELVRTGRA
jgi:hypothetical protein